MILLIAGPALVIYVLILGIAAFSQYRQSKQEVELSMTRLAASYSSRFDGKLRDVARIADTTARFLDTGVQISDEVIYELLEDNVKQTPLVYGSCLAFEPGTRRPAGELFAPYVYRGQGRLATHEHRSRACTIGLAIPSTRGIPGPKNWAGPCGANRISTKGRATF